MFCPRCGNQLNDGAVFCPKCGTKISIGEASASDNTLKTNNVTSRGYNAPGNNVNRKRRKVAAKSISIAIIAMVLCLIGCFFPIYSLKGDFLGATGSYGYHISSFFDMENDLEMVIMAFPVWLIFFANIACISSGKIAHFISSVVVSIILIVIIYKIHSEMGYESLSLGGVTLAGAGIVAGMGYYLWILSEICVVLSLIVHFMESKEDPALK